MTAARCSTFIGKWPIRSVGLLPPALLAAIFLFALGSTTQSTASENAGPEIVRLQIGFQGYFKVGYWTPIRVGIRAGDQAATGHVEITTRDNDGLDFLVQSDSSIHIEIGKTKSVLLYIKPSRRELTLRVAWRNEDNGEVLAQRKFDSDVDSEINPSKALRVRERLIITIGPPVGLDAINRTVTRAGRGVIRIVGFESFADLPTQGCGYEGVDQVLLTTNEPKVLKLANQQIKQIAALSAWVKNGGRLTVSAAKQTAALLQNKSPLSQFVPGKLLPDAPKDDSRPSARGTVLIQQAGALEQYCGAKEPMNEQSGIDRANFQLIAARLNYDSVNTEATFGDLPLVVKKPLGFGHLTFVAVDLDRPPIKNWSGKGLLFAKILGYETSAATDPEKVAEESIGPRTSVYSDLSQPLRHGMDRFDDVQDFPFWGVAGLILAYILLIGPVDYFLLRNVIRRMHFAWLTLPLFIFVFAAGAYWLTYRTKGENFQVNQIDVIDIDLTNPADNNTAWVRGTSWYNVFCPRVERYDFTFVPSFEEAIPIEDSKVALSWSGVPNRDRSDVHTAADLPRFAKPYRAGSNLDSIEGLVVPKWSTKSLFARWSGRARIANQTQLKIGVSGWPTGQIVNPLGVSLNNCVLFFRTRAFPLGSLKAHETITLSDFQKSQSIRMYLNEGRDSSSNSGYDTHSLDTRRIVELIMFHQAAGGHDYTKLENDYYAFLDASEIMTSDAAILIGTSASRGSRLARHDEEQAEKLGDTFTIFRIVVPVQTKQNRP